MAAPRCLTCGSRRRCPAGCASPMPMRPDSRVGMRSLCVAALAGRPVAFRGEEGKKKRQLTLPNIGSAAGTRASRERRTRVRKTGINTFCCHGDRNMQLIIPHLVCVSSWREADAGRGGARVGVETKTFVRTPNDTRRSFPTRNLGGFSIVRSEYRSRKQS